MFFCYRLNHFHLAAMKKKCVQSVILFMNEVHFMPLGHSEPDRGGAAAGPHQLLPQLHGAHQATKKKVSL